MTTTTTDKNSIASFQDLVNLLESDGVPHQSDVAGMMVQIPTQRGSLDSVMLIRWQKDDGVIQFIQALPLTVPDDKLAAAVDAVTRLNHVLAIPGFDVNHERKLLAYRLYLPIHPRGAVTAVEVQAMFSLAVKSASELLPVLARVVAGQIKPEEVVADAQQEYAKQAAPTPAAPASNMY